MQVVQAYRYALDPTPRQERALRSHCGAVRLSERVFACTACDLVLDRDVNAALKSGFPGEAHRRRKWPGDDKRTWSRP